ncbi:hypothetical protein N7478_011450 [Penicillium angulare]|uniref:uncharacterized protein n=1 Tax=Penicillium angulare TaxID=116970 RepID=UPI002541C326|nr:uncharacterized protein N7478_011450 [Penicillium angulare]KAJ5263845.1 hypothetical protein N7478_011450 [Penicillium angulare]
MATFHLFTSIIEISFLQQERIERKINSLRPPLESDVLYNEEQQRDLDEVGIDYSDLSPLLRDSSGVLHQEEPKTTQIPVFQTTLCPRVTKFHEKGFKILQHKLDETNHQRSQLSRRLYEMETMLPDLVKQNYESIRKDPNGYMRKELVKDCADRGGCCGHRLRMLCSACQKCL